MDVDRKPDQLQRRVRDFKLRHDPVFDCCRLQPTNRQPLSQRIFTPAQMALGCALVGMSLTGDRQKPGGGQAAVATGFWSGVMLTDLDYDWPRGFARFEIEIWNRDRDLFNHDELESIAPAIGHRTACGGSPAVSS